VRKTRADGSIIEYFYDRQTRKFLGHNREAALASLENLSPLQAAGLNPGTIGALIIDYLKRSEDSLWKLMFFSSISPASFSEVTPEEFRSAIDAAMDAEKLA